MRNLQAIELGDRVFSTFEIVTGFELHPIDFSEYHIGISASFGREGIYGNPHIAHFWKTLGAPDSALWQPGSRMSGSGHIVRLVRLAVELYLEADLLPIGGRHNVWGEVVLFDQIEREEDGDDRDFPDSVPHIDFVSPEVHCAALFASNLGGTVGWRGGDGYIYNGNTQSSYSSELIHACMEQCEVRPGEFIFTSDARTFIHARSPSVSNNGRLLVRLFLGS